MLDEKDLHEIQEIMDSSLIRSQNMILKELDRVQDNMQYRINQVEKNLHIMREQLGVLR